MKTFELLLLPACGHCRKALIDNVRFYSIFYSWADTFRELWNTGHAKPQFTDCPAKLLAEET